MTLKIIEERPDVLFTLRGCSFIITPARRYRWRLQSQRFLMETLVCPSSVHGTEFVYVHSRRGERDAAVMIDLEKAISSRHDKVMWAITWNGKALRGPGLEGR